MRYRYNNLPIGTICLGLMLIFNLPVFAQEHSSVADFLFETGKKYYEQGNYEQALHELGKVLLVEPEHGQTLMYIQIIEKELGLTQLEKKEEIEQIQVSVEEFTREEAVTRALAEARAKIIAGEKILLPVVEAAEVIEEEVKEKAVVEEELKPEEKPLPLAPEVPEIIEEEVEEEVIAEEPYPLLGKGKTFIELYNKYYWHNTQFDEDGTRKRWADNGKYHEVMTELKIEHGLTENLTLLGSIPYKMAVWKDDDNRNVTSGVGDIWMRLKYRLFDQREMPFALDLQPGLRFPGGYDENDSPSLGKGEIAGELRFLATRSFSPLPYYGKIETGFRPRAEEPTNEVPYFFELGYHPTDWLMFKTTIDGVEGLGGTGEVEEDYTKWTAHIIYSPKGGFSIFREEGTLNLELGYGNTFEGKNTSNGSEVIFNIKYQF